jgi:hypothetical protein
MLLQAAATLAGGFLPLAAEIFCLVLAVFLVIDPLRHMRARRRPAKINGQTAGS